MRIWTLTLTAVCLALIALPRAAAQEQADLPEQAKQAYQAVDRYENTIGFKVRQQQGRWSSTQEAEIYVAFDREAGKLLVDKPDFRLVVADGKLRLSTPQVSGRHVEADAPDPLTYEALMSAAPVLGNPPMADVALLLSDDPFAAMSSGGAAKVIEPAEDGAPRLEVPTQMGPMTITFDPQSKLVRESELTVDVSQYGGGSGDSMKLSQRSAAQTGEAALANADELFAFDTSGSQAVDSLQALFQGGGGGAAGGGGGGGGHALEGQAAPQIELATLDGKQFDLERDGTEVVVLDFWATWCGPCREALPKLQEVHDWAQQEHAEAVSVYTVNVAETEQEAQRFWENGGYTMPVLMDKQGEVAGAYRAEAIPQTVVIHDGQVVNVHVGYSPGIADQLKQEIGELLARDDSRE